MFIVSEGSFKNQRVARADVSLAVGFRKPSLTIIRKSQQ